MRALDLTAEDQQRADGQEATASEGKYINNHYCIKCLNQALSSRLPFVKLNAVPLAVHYPSTSAGMRRMEDL